MKVCGLDSLGSGGRMEAASCEQSNEPSSFTKCGERGLRFHPQYHISYKWGYYTAPLHINVFSKCYVQ
jgi:hypothetical protein